MTKGVACRLNEIVGPGSREKVWFLPATAAERLLVSNLCDAFFRIFNGNTRVSATGAPALPMPPLAAIGEIGRRVPGQGQEATDAIVGKILIHA